MAAPELEDFQFWFGSPNEDGRVFGIDTDIAVVSAEGLARVVVRSGTRELPRNDGSVPGLHLMSSKDPIFELEVSSEDGYQDYMDSFNIMPDEEGELHWKWPDQDQVFMRARVLGRSDRRDGFSYDVFPSTLAFEVANPRIYANFLKSQNLSIFDTAGEGIDFNIDFNVDFLVTGSGGGDYVLTNDGNTDAYPIIRFYGPVSGTTTGVKLENLTHGDELDITATILAGQVLTADMESRATGAGRRIIDLDGSSRYADWELPRETFKLHPGDNVIRLTITGTSTDVIAIIQWRDTSY